MILHTCYVPATDKLSRELDEYTHSSPAAIVGRQLKTCGKTLERGQQARFIYIGPGPGIHAWDLPRGPDPKIIDVPRYRELVLRAVCQVLQPLHVTEKIMRDWLLGKAGYIAPPGRLDSSDPTRLALPLFAGVDRLRVN